MPIDFPIRRDLFSRSRELVRGQSWYELSRDLNCAGITGVSASTMPRRNRWHVPFYVRWASRPLERFESRRSPSHARAKIEKFLDVLFCPQSPDINSNRGIIVSFPASQTVLNLNPDYAPGYFSSLFSTTREILIRRFVREELVLAKENTLSDISLNALFSFSLYFKIERWKIIIFTFRPWVCPFYLFQFGQGDSERLLNFSFGDQSKYRFLNKK